MKNLFNKRDPVCGIKVGKNTEYILKYNGKAYYFDSQACRETFRECPHRFLKKSAMAEFVNWLVKGSKGIPKSCHEIKK